MKQTSAPAYMLTGVGLLGLTLAAPVSAEVSLERGPTPIVGGDAINEGDITIRNEHFVISLAVETEPPWGVAPGGIIDASPVRGEGRAPVDVMSLFDLIPNNWSDWPTSYQEFTVAEDGPDEAVVRVERDWREVDMVTTYTVEAGSDMIHVTTEMTNNGDEDIEDLLSGYALWSDGGNIFSTPGLKGVEEGPADDAFADWMAMYAENWSMGMHAPYFDTVAYESRDMYLSHDLETGETQTFEGWLQIRSDGDLSPIAEAAAERKGDDTGSVSGKVTTSDGDAVDKPWVVVERDGETYFWARGRDGTVDFPTPAGDYSVYATAAGHARSDEREVSVEAGSSVEQDFDGLQPPGTVRFEVEESSQQAPLDARIELVEGETPVIGFLGQSTFFTELDPAGVREAKLAPGEYLFEVSHAKGFRTTAAEESVTVDSGETARVETELTRLVRPNERNWYMADLHHHSDILDGFTPPEWVVRSQLAEGLDIVHLSDHDSLANLAKTGEFSRQRNVPFIPGVEFSPSWGHFIAAPVDWGQEIEIDVGDASAAELFAEGRRMGADFISAAHPRNNYGYFTSLDRGAVPGGFTAEFDFIELNSATFPEEAIKDARAAWDQGWKYYLSGGSDVHDVWDGANSEGRSGRMRTVAYVPSELTVDNYVDAALAGNSYTTMGPVIYPETMFGSTINVTEGEATDLGFTVKAVEGLASVKLVGNGGTTVAETTFEDGPLRREIEFSPEPKENGWYALVVEDTAENKAYANPIWVNVVSDVFNSGEEESDDD